MLSCGNRVDYFCAAEGIGPKSTLKLEASQALKHMHRFEFQFAHTRLANAFVNLATWMSFRAPRYEKR